MTKVTIMIPTYNQREYIEQCIESALAQDYSNLEVVVSDDSTDKETEKIVTEKYLKDPRVKYFHNSPGLGRVKNYHKTLYERATGEYVLNLDGDDWLIDVSYITQAVNLLDNDKQIVCVTANKIQYHENNNEFIKEEAYNQTLQPVMSGQAYLYEYAMHKVSFNHMTTLYRREDALKIGFYDKDIILTDGESVFRLICDQKIAFLPIEAGVWRVHGENATHQQLDVDDINVFFAVEDSIIKYCAAHNTHMGRLLLREWEFKMKIKRVYPIVYAYILGNKPWKLLSLCKKIYRYDPKFFWRFLPSLGYRAVMLLKQKIWNG